MQLKLKPYVLSLLASSAMVVAAPALATPVVVTFEDVPATGLADGYGGMSGWLSMGDISLGSYSGLDRDFYGPQTPSGALRFDSAPVVFNGTEYKSLVPFTGIPPTTAIELFYQGTLVHSILDPWGNTLQWLPSGYSGLVDSIQFYGGIEGFVIDNLAYEVATTTVPEPGSVLLVFSGLLGLGWVRRGKAPDLLFSKGVAP